jgi:hypothetical protein
MRLNGLRASRLLIAAMWALAGCTSPRPLMLSEPVGPMEPRSIAVDSVGTLVVYSDREASPQDPADTAPHSRYMLFSEDGKLLRWVENVSAPDARQPAQIQLPEGKYSIVAMAANVGWVKVDIVVKKSHGTIVDLNKEMIPSAPLVSRNWVRLPNGNPIGPRAP